MRSLRQQTAGELANKALKDNTNYNAREVGEAICSDTDKELRKCIENHRNIIDEIVWRREKIYANAT